MVIGFAHEKKMFFTRYTRRKCPLWITRALRPLEFGQPNGRVNADNAGGREKRAYLSNIRGLNLRGYPQQVTPPAT